MSKEIESRIEIKVTGLYTDKNPTKVYFNTISGYDSKDVERQITDAIGWIHDRQLDAIRRLEFNSKKIIDRPPTEYEKITFEGRQICQARKLGAAYCGSGTLENHCLQIRDGKSWVQSSKDEWFEVGYKAKHGD